MLCKQGIGDCRWHEGWSLVDLDGGGQTTLGSVLSGCVQYTMGPSACKRAAEKRTSGRRHEGTQPTLQTAEERPQAKGHRAPGAAKGQGRNPAVPSRRELALHTAGFEPRETRGGLQSCRAGRKCMHAVPPNQLGWGSRVSPRPQDTNAPTPLLAGCPPAFGNGNVTLLKWETANIVVPPRGGRL